MSEPLADQLEALTVDERQRAVRALLRKPFIVAEGTDAGDFALVRRHRSALASWLQAELGYRLVVDSDFARLHKMPLPRPLHSRRLQTRAGQAFDSRRYVLFCLTLAALEQAGDQTTLASLGETVTLHSADLEGFDLDFDRVADRRAFMHSVRAIVDLGVLMFRDGDEERFARKEQGGDALYQVRHRRLAQVLSSPLPPSSVDDPYLMSFEAYPETDDGRARRSRHRLMRMLIESPTVYFDDLSDEDRAYLNSQRSRVFRQLESFCGFDVELRIEGVAVIDDTGESSDLAFPSEGTIGHAALLLGEEIARRARAEEATITLAEIETHVRKLAAQYGRYWSHEFAGDAEGHRRLAGLATERLVAFAMLDRVEDGVRPRPALARFSAVMKGDVDEREP
jgi:uncharacterized protein (TIGR02678 family)